IVTHTGAGVLAAQQATATIPIVVTIGPDLVELGLVASLAQPSGNITGQILRDAELAGKRLGDFLKRISLVVVYGGVDISMAAPPAGGSWEGGLPWSRWAPMPSRSWVAPHLPPPVGGRSVSLTAKVRTRRADAETHGETLPEITLELLKDAVPTITHVTLLVDPVRTLSPPYVRASEAAAHALGIRLQRVDAGTPEAIDAALGTVATGGANALMIQDSAMFSAQRQRLLDFARPHRLPMVCGGRSYVEAG